MEPLPLLQCTSVSSDNTLTMAKATAAAAKGATATATAFCPADSPVALGGFSNADGTILQDLASAPVWGTSASPVMLADVPDGATGAPAGWQTKVANTGNAASNIASIAICGKAPGLQTAV